MTFQQLQETISSCTTGGLLKIEVNTFGTGSIQSLLTNYYYDETLYVNVRTNQSASEVISIEGSIPADKFPFYTVTEDLTTSVKFYLVSDEPQMELDISLPSDFKFSLPYTGLANSPIDSLEIEHSHFILQSSELNSLMKKSPIIEGLNFLSGLKSGGPLSTIAPVTSHQENFQLVGAITYRIDPDTNLSDTTSPLLDLYAQVLEPFDVGPFSLNFKVLAEATFTEFTLKNPDGTNYDYTPLTKLSSIVDINSARKVTPLAVSMWLVDDMAGSYTFTLDAPFDLGSSLLALSDFVGVPLENYLPEQFSFDNSLVLNAMSVVIGDNDVNSLTSLGLVSIQMDVNSNNRWDIIPNYIAVTNVGVNFTVNYLGSKTQVIATFYAKFDLAGVLFGAQISYPELSFTAYLDQGYSIDTNAVLQQLIGSGITLPGSDNGTSDLNIYTLFIQASPLTQTYYVSATIGQDNIMTLDMIFITVTLRRFSFEINYSPNGLELGLTGYFLVGGVKFDMIANRPTSGNWVFSGGMESGETISLTELTSYFLQFDPAGLPTLEIEGIWCSLDTGTGAYSVQGRTAGFWEFDLTDDYTLKIAASALIESDGKNLGGTLIGDFFINNLEIKVTYQFSEKSTTFIFMIAYNKLMLQATLQKSRITDDKGTRDVTTLQINFGDLTFGEIVEYLVNLVDPDADFQMESPWDVLNEINFKNLSLTINLTDETVSIDYRIDLNLIFVDIETIGLIYKTEKGKGKIDVKITGRFLEKEYGNADPLTWDLLDDPPPSVQGQGSKFLDLRYVGLGQHISLQNYQSFEHVEDVIDAMIENMRPPGEGELPAVGSGNAHGLVFDEESNILFGLEFELLSSFRLAAVFNDPYLYGLLISLYGDKIPSLKGLRFEILYVKITDDIGVFKIELKLPDTFRNLEFGSVSVTLPVIRLEIYTNGNFRVDIGFPHGGKFDDSFAIQIFPFIGRGGFYFAYLTGATSKRVPEISNGEFNPVIEAGFGLAVGLGKSFNKGPLKAELSVTVQGILEGTLAWFNPDDSSLPDPMYYWIQGTIAIVGKLYGAVDFKVIKVDVSVEAYASATLTVEAFMPIEVELKVGVKAKASVKVLFVKVHFSFSIEIKETFTIGHRSTPPWTLGPRQSTSSSSGNSLRSQNSAKRASHRSVRRMAKSLAVPQSQSLGTVGSQAQNLSPEALALLQGVHWDPVNVFDGNIETIPIFLLPAFTVANTSSLIDGTGSDVTDQVVMTLFVENTIPVDESHDATTVFHEEEDALKMPFNLLIKGMLGYSIAAVSAPNATTITSDKLQLLYDILNDPDTEESGFTYDSLVAFLAANYKFEVSGPPVDSLDTGAEPIPTSQLQEISATIFPMIPEFTMDYNYGDDSVDFGTYSMVDEAYEVKIQNYFNQLAKGSSDYVATDPLTPNFDRDSSRETGEVESMASMIFKDYFLMIAKSSVQEAIDLMAKYIYEVQEDDTLATIADSFEKEMLTYTTKEGDTVDTIALQFDTSPEEIIQENGLGTDGELLAPNTTLIIPVGITPYSIAEDNLDVEFNTEQAITLTLQNIKYQVATHDTIQSLTTKFEQSSVTDLLSANADDSSLFLVRSSMHIRKTGETWFKYAPLATDSLDLVAAIFLARNGIFNDSANKNIANTNASNWYQATIADLNPTVTFGIQSNLNPSASLDAGVTLKVPDTYGLYDQSTGTIDTIDYVTRNGDTLTLIAQYFQLMQTPDASFSTYQTYQDFVNSISTENGYTGVDPDLGAEMKIPALERVIVATDTVNLILRTYNPTGEANGLQLTDIATENKDVDYLLAPLAVLNIPTVSHNVATGDTMASVAGKFSITVDELVEDIQDVQNLYPANETGVSSENSQLTITDIPVVDIDNLLKEVVCFGNANNTAAMVSRFLMHGLRLPDPNSTQLDQFSAEQLGSTAYSALNLFGIFELTGQQFTGPEKTIQNQYPIVFSKSTGADWIEFRTAVIAHPGDPITYGPVEQELEIDLDPTYLAAEYPSTDFKPEFVGPTAMKLYKEKVVRYSFASYIHWQTAVNIDIPKTPGTPATVNPPTAGEPTIWKFPAALETKVAGGFGLRHDFALQIHDNTSPDIESHADVNYYAWGSLFKVDIRQISRNDGSQVPLTNTYEITGASQGDRDIMLALWGYLYDVINNEQNMKQAQVYLLSKPNAQSANPSGLQSFSMNLTETFILKTNLQTDPHGDNTQLRDLLDDDGDFFATDLTDGRKFIRFLWEGTIIASGGYFINYEEAGTGNGLPANIFDENGAGELWFVVLTDEQLQANPNRNLFPFNNCAIVGDNIDAGTTNVFAQVTDFSDMTTFSSVAPGNVGFEMTRTNPGLQGGLAPDQLLTDSLYSLLGYQLIDLSGSSLFNTSNEGLPLGPTNPLGLEDLDTDRLEDWYYHQVVPIAQFAKSHPLPVSAALPDNLADPYAGIAASSKANFSFVFHDVYGNKTTLDPSVSLNDLAVDVGYYDEIIGLSQWPGATSNYIFSPDLANNTAIIHLLLQLHTTNYLPIGGTDYQTAVYNSSAHQLKYQQIYYQLAQADVALHLSNSMNQSGETGPPHQYDVDKVPVLNFVQGSYTFLTTALNQQKVSLTYDSTKDTLDKLLEGYPVTPGELGDANQDKLLVQLFSGDVVKPEFHITASGDSLASIAPTKELELVQNNPEFTLKKGRTFKRNTTTSTIDRDSTDQYYLRTQRKVAEFLETTVENIAINNSTANILAGGYSITVYSITIDVVGPTSFSALEQQFNDQEVPVLNGGETGTHISIGDIAAASEDIKDFFIAEVTLSYDEYVTQTGDTFSKLATKFKQTLDTVVDNAKYTRDIYPEGDALYIASSQATPAAHETVIGFVSTWAISIDQFFSYNSGTALQTTNSNPAPLAPTNQVILPGYNSVPTDDYYVPYTVDGSNSLTAISTLFAGSQGATSALSIISTVNRYMPSMMQDGAVINVNGQTITASATDSLQDIFVDSQMTDYDSFIAAISGMTDIFRNGGFMACPIPTSTAGDTLQSVANRFNLTVDAIAQANGATFSFLADGGGTEKATVTIDSVTKEVVIGSNYTMGTLVQKFAEQEMNISISEIALQNPTLQVSGNVNLFLPPADLPMQISMGNNYLANPNYPDPLFELTTTFSIDRNYNFVDQHFRGVEKVYHSETKVAPRSNSDSSGSMVLKAFALTFEDTFHKFKVATASQQYLTDGETSIKHLYAVNFGTDGFKDLSFEPTPAFFAIKPLATFLLAKSDVEIQPYENGVLGPAATVDYQNIDMDVWASQFLTAVDLFLTPQYSVPAFELAETGDSSVGKVIAAKKILANAIAQNIDYILVDNPTDADKDSAIAAMTQELDLQLSNAYSINTIIQFISNLNSPYTETTTAPKLSGTPVVSNNGVNDKDRSLSAGKTDLVNGKDATNFMLSVANAEIANQINMDINYVVNEMQYDLTPLVDGFRASSWLSFILPIGVDETGVVSPFDTDLGRIAVPVPLRAYPVPPTIVSQGYDPSYVGDAIGRTYPQDVENASLWNFDFTYQHQEASQDTEYIDLDFNITDEEHKSKSQKLGSSSNTELFDALAQFNTVYPQIAEDLKLLLADGFDTNPVVSNAVSTFADLVSRVALKWSAFAVEPPTTSQEVLHQYKYRLRNSYGIVENVKTGIELTPITTPANPSTAFPTVEFYFTTDDVSSKQEMIGPTPIGDGSVKYEYPLDENGNYPSMGTIIDHIFTFKDLNIFSFNNAIAGAYIKRNETLLDAETGEHTAVSDKFIYETPLVFSSNILNPLISHAEPILFKGSSSNLNEALTDLFDTLFTTNVVRIKISVGYGYTLLTNTVQKTDKDGNTYTHYEEIVSQVPITFHPAFVWNQPNAPAGQTNSDFVTELVNTISTWESDKPLSTEGGRYVFNLIAFSILDTEAPRPLLELKNLVYLLG